MDLGTQTAGWWRSPPGLIALIIRSLKQDAERFLGESLWGAALTVPPAYGAETNLAVCRIGAATAEVSHLCAQALTDSSLSRDQISQAVLCGGQAAMPAVRRALAEVFGRTTLTRVLPMEVTPFGLGVGSVGGRVTHLAPRNKTIPFMLSKTFSPLDGQRNSVTITVYQGDSALADEDVEIGRLSAHSTSTGQERRADMLVDRTHRYVVTRLKISSRRRGSWSMSGR